MNVFISSENVIWAIFQESPTEKDKVEKTAQYFKGINKLKQPFYQAPSNDNGEKDSMTFLPECDKWEFSRQRRLN